MNKQISVVLIIVSLIFTLTSCSRQQVNGSGASKQETREVSEFTGLNIDGNYSILGTISSPQRFVISTNENLLPFIETNVKDGILTIQNKSSTDLHPTSGQSIWFYVPSFESLTLNGISKFQLTNLDSEKLSITLTGSHRLLLTGKAGDLTINVSGNSTIDARNLAVNNANIELNGAGTVYLNVANTLSVKINGSGKVVYFNQTPKIEKTVNGAGDVISGFGGLTNQKGN